MTTRQVSTSPADVRVTGNLASRRVSAAERERERERKRRRWRRPIIRKMDIGGSTESGHTSNTFEQHPWANLDS